MARHTLAEKGIRVFRPQTVDDWKRDFDEACTFDPNLPALCGRIRNLLRGDYGGGETRKAIGILLNLADGHKAEADFFTAKDEKVPPLNREFFESVQHFRQELASQAWTELCRYVFTSPRSGVKLARFYGDLVVPSDRSFDLIDKLLKFFNPKPDGYAPNAPSDWRLTDKANGEVRQALTGINTVLDRLWTSVMPSPSDKGYDRIRELRVQSIPVMLAYELHHETFGRHTHHAEWPLTQLLEALREKILDSAGKDGKQPGMVWLSSCLKSGNKDAQLYQRLFLYSQELEDFSSRK